MNDLAKPGAGLPPFELAVMKVVFPLVAKFKSRESFQNLFAEELDLIRKLIEASPDPEKPVLIKRIRGIEDSSRNWSVYMTLNHLHQVNSALVPLIRLLAAEKTSDRKVRIEDVKPAPGLGAEVVPEFEESAGQFLTKIPKIPSLESKATHHHPWFGPMNARQIHALTAVHMRIHRKQIEAIIAGQSSS